MALLFQNEGSCTLWCEQNRAAMDVLMVVQVIDEFYIELKWPNNKR